MNLVGSRFPLSWSRLKYFRVGEAARPSVRREGFAFGLSPSGKSRADRLHHTLNTKQLLIQGRDVSAQIQLRRFRSAWKTTQLRGAKRDVLSLVKPWKQTGCHYDDTSDVARWTDPAGARK